MRAVLLLALVGAAFAAVPRSPKNMPQRIVGGTATTIDQYPYMSNMLRHEWGTFWDQACGGSLITTRTVLSAAHCYYGNRPSEWRVRLGSSFASSGGDVHDVSALILHELYRDDFTYKHDVAIVRLATPANLGGSIAIVRIAATDYHLADGTTVTAIGWGALRAGGQSPEQLNHVDVRIVNQQICHARYASLRNPTEVTEGMLCAGLLDVGGKDACQGDSGGPLAYKAPDGHVIIGVTSWGRGCAQAAYPGVNARVSHYSDWIVTHGSA